MKQLTRVLALVLALGILTLAVGAGAEGAETYAESPILASQVEAGELPPVAERLPLEPKLVHEVLDSDLDYEIGNYGGTLVTGTTAVNWNSDVFVGSNEALLSMSSTIREAEAYMHRNPETMLFVVGEQGRQYCQNKKIPIVEEFHYSAAFPTVWEARKICTDLLEYYDAGQLDEIDIIYTEYQNGKPAQCQRNCLLPLERSQLCPTLDEPPQTGKEFFPDPDTVLEGIIPSYLTGFIYSCLVDSYCSEQEARMTAMSSAGKNAEEILKKLQMQYNSLRQAAITREMVEITSGAKALKRKREKNQSGGQTF